MYLLAKYPHVQFDNLTFGVAIYVKFYILKLKLLTATFFVIRFVTFCLIR